QFSSEPTFPLGKIDGDLGFLAVGQPDLRSLRLQPDNLHMVWIVHQINIEGAADFVHKEIGDAAVDVVAAQVGIAVGGQHFKNAVFQLENGNIESAASEVIHGDRSLRFLLEPI